MEWSKKYSYGKWKYSSKVPQTCTQVQYWSKIDLVTTDNTMKLIA